MGKHGGKLNYYKMKEASVKRLYTDDSSIWHSGKLKLWRQ
jgi:hypothetical protein